VFGDLTAAYDNVWDHGLTCILLQLLPDRHMIMETVGNCSFTVTTRNGRSSYDASRTASHRDLLWHPFSSIIYISDLPTTVSRKYAYAVNLEIMHVDGDWQAVEEVLSIKDLVALYPTLNCLDQS